jgi:putative transposase
VFVGAVIDGFSRKVLALHTTAHEPTAAFAVQLVRDAVRDHGAAPTWVITDQGSQLTSAEFTRALRTRRIRRRFGAVGESGSISLIERWWKSFKVEFANGLILYRPLPAIEARMRAYVRWFNTERPHQGLDERTPDEVHLGHDTRAKVVPLLAALAVHHVDGERDLPVLTLRRAA